MFYLYWEILYFEKISSFVSILWYLALINEDAIVNHYSLCDIPHWIGKKVFDTI